MTADDNAIDGIDVGREGGDVVPKGEDVDDSIGITTRVDGVDGADVTADVDGDDDNTEVYDGIDVVEDNYKDGV